MVVALVLLAGPAFAHGDGGHGTIEERTYEASGTVSPGSFAEVDFEAREGDTLTWAVSATNEVNVNLHEHEMGTVYFVRENATQAAEGSFTVPHNGTFSLMIVGRQGGSDASVEVTLEGPFAVVGSQNLVEAGREASAPVAGLLVLAIGLLTVAVRRR